MPAESLRPAMLWAANGYPWAARPLVGDKVNGAWLLVPGGDPHYPGTSVIAPNEEAAHALCDLLNNAASPGDAASPRDATGPGSLCATCHTEHVCPNRDTSLACTPVPDPDASCALCGSGVCAQTRHLWRNIHGVGWVCNACRGTIDQHTHPLAHWKRRYARWQDYWGGLEARAAARSVTSSSGAYYSEFIPQGVDMNAPAMDAHLAAALVAELETLRASAPRRPVQHGDTCCAPSPEPAPVDFADAVVAAFRAKAEHRGAPPDSGPGKAFLEIIGHMARAQSVAVHLRREEMAAFEPAAMRIDALVMAVVRQVAQEAVWTTVAGEADATWCSLLPGGVTEDEA